MIAILRNALALAAVVFATQAAAQVTFYEHEGFQGRSIVTEGQVDDFHRIGFNDRASSVEVVGERVEICQHTRFRGRCLVLRPASYPSLAAIGMNDGVSSVRAIRNDARVDDSRYAPLPPAAPVATAQVTFYEHEAFHGRSFVTATRVEDFRNLGFSDRASSVEVVGERYEVCQDSWFRGRCMVLRPGLYPSLAAMGLNDRVSSVRVLNRNDHVADNRYAPLPVPVPVVAAQATLYEQAGFQGRSFVTQQAIVNFERFGFNDRASSVEIVGERWEVCEDSRFSGHCMVLRPGRYPSLVAMGLNNRVSSARVLNRNDYVADNRYAPLPVPVAVVAAQATLYERAGFQGRSFVTQQAIVNFERFGFNDRASSVEIVGERWEVCEDSRFSGRCMVLRPGRYPSLVAMGLNNRVSSARALNRDDRVADNRYAPLPVPVVVAEITFYEQQGFGGRSFVTQRQVNNFERFGFNDRASSVEVVGERWEVCEDSQFSGRCVVLRPGRYPSLAAMGLNNRVSSVRLLDSDVRIDDRRYAPAPGTFGDYRRRDNERLYEANVTRVRAVHGTPEQRCWTEQEQVTQERGKASVPGAIIGGILGGILGHQVGGGSGKDIATVGGVVAGAAVGANVGRSSGATTTQDVQRCETVQSQAAPTYWDVTYNFRGQDYQMQTSTAPGPTVTVNERGEPRI